MKRNLLVLLSLTVVLCLSLSLAACGHRHVCDNECNSCGVLRNRKHSYDNGCDAECNVCGTVRDAEKLNHTYDSTCDAECNICHTTREPWHAYAAPCSVRCYHCNEITRETGETGHTYMLCSNRCEFCGEKLEGDYMHTFDNKCDKTCNNCDFTRETEHVYDGDSDLYCNECHLSRDGQSHEPGHEPQA